MTGEECDGHDHRFDSYAASDRRLLGLVQAFNRRLVDAAGRGADLTNVFAALDPDPARYTWVDEGGGIVEAVLAEAEAELASAPSLEGFRLLSSQALGTRRPAARPAVATAPDGRQLLCWVEWTEHVGEQVVAVMTDETGRPLSEPQAVSGDLGDCLRPSAAFDGGGTGYVFFGFRRKGHVGVFFSRSSGGGWSAPALVSTTPHPSFNQEVVRHPDGRLECCWQGYDDGRFRIYSRRQIGRAGFGGTRLLSADGERNVWDPTIAVDGSGRSCHAWTTYGEGGYETALLLGEPGRQGHRRLIAAPGAYSLHPSVAFTPDGALWCAYDSVSLSGHGGSGPTRLRHRSELGSPAWSDRLADGQAVPGDLAPAVAARVSVVRLEDPAGDLLATAPVGVGTQVSPAGLPRLVATAGGRLAVAYRSLRRLPLMLYFWDVVLEWHDSAAGWGHLTTFDEPDGPLEEPAVASTAAGVVVSWQQDGRRERQLAWTEGFGGEECSARREHYGEAVWHSLHTGGRIRLGEVPAPPVRAASGHAGGGGDRHTLGDRRGHSAGDRRGRSPGDGAAGLAERPDGRPWAVARRRDPERPRSRYSTTAGDRRYELYWGDLHRHSLISRCTAGDEPSLDDFYRYSFDVCEYDFWAVTDHAENTSQYQWWSIQKLADVLNVEGRFVPFYGFEWTAATGHQNVVYESAVRDAPIYSSTAAETSRPDQLWRELRKAGQRCLTIPHHPGSAMVPCDWSYHDEEMLRLVEIFQACRGNYEHDGCFRQYSDGTLSGTFVTDGLLAGHRFGLISSSDHGNGASYVGAFAERLSRDAVFDALYGRRTIAATTRDIVVDLRLNGCFMGSEAPAAETASIDVRASGYRDVARLDIVRNGRVVHSLQPEIETRDGEIAVPIRVEWSSGSAARTVWNGSLEVGGGGRVLETTYWSPGIFDVTSDRIAWEAETRNFRSQYGSQRGGVELTVLGRPDTQIAVSTSTFGGAVALGELSEAGRVELAKGDEGTLGLQLSTGGLLSLGESEVATAYEEPIVGASWYYARVMLEDGEMAWSSPVWVSPS
jgi:hypothetical protein